MELFVIGAVPMGAYLILQVYHLVRWLVVWAKLKVCRTESQHIIANPAADLWIFFDHNLGADIIL